MRYIYRITNTINNKTYIGQHVLPKGRTPMADGYLGSGTHLKCSQKKYGRKYFKKEIIVCFFGDCQKYVDEAEKYYISLERKNKGCENVYNISDGGEKNIAGRVAWNKGKKMSEDFCNKCKKPKSEEAKENMSKGRKGMKLSEEHKKNISNARKGHSSTLKGLSWKVIDGKRVWINKEENKC